MRVSGAGGQGVRVRNRVSNRGRLRVRKRGQAKGWGWGWNLSWVSWDLSWVSWDWGRGCSAYRRQHIGRAMEGRGSLSWWSRWEPLSGLDPVKVRVGSRTGVGYHGLETPVGL